MGHYTEFHFNARLKPDLPADVVAILQALFNNAYMPMYVMASPHFKHPLFAEDSRWRNFLHGDSAYFETGTATSMVFSGWAPAWVLHVRCNCKNYSNEIQNFVDWVTPFVDAPKDELLGFFRSEGQQWPTLVFHPNCLHDSTPESRTTPCL